MKRSDISGFKNLTHEERVQKVKEFAELTDEEAELLKKTGSMDIETASRIIENVVGTFELPFGISTNFLIDGKDYLIPMVLEEPSVVAASSYAAKLARSLALSASTVIPKGEAVEKTSLVKSSAKIATARMSQEKTKTMESEKIR